MPSPVENVESAGNAAPLTALRHGPALEQAIRASIQGEVRFDAGARALYATDASNYRHVPLGVVWPKTVSDVETVIRLCRAHGAPLLSRGGGTSLAGQTCNEAVVMDWSKHLNRVLEIDVERRLARVEPGCVLDHLRHAAERDGLTFGPDPATHDHNTLGGMLGNNSCGTHSVMAGRTVDNTEWLEVLTYDGVRLRVGPTSPAALAAKCALPGREGQIYRDLSALIDEVAPLVRARFPKIPRRVSGYGLDSLLTENGFNVARALVGTEGTCVTILEAGLQLIPWPRGRALVVLGFPDVYRAADHAAEVRKYGPIALEGMDDLLVDFMRRKHLHADAVKHLPEGHGWLFAEFGGSDDAEARLKAEPLVVAMKGKAAVKVFTDRDAQAQVWKARDAGLGATARVPGMADAWEGWEDSAVPPERLGEYLRELRKLLDRYGYQTTLYGHFGDGCVHARITFDLSTRAGAEAYRSFGYEASELVTRLGGSLSGEHGDGQSRAEMLSIMFGPELVRAFERFKGIWDPDWKMNPGKIVRPRGRAQDLRLGPDRTPLRLWATHFSFANDRNSLAYATERCVGVGACRRSSGGVMCPSFRATHEEEHSPRGRAHLLFEMFEGDPLSKGHATKHVKEALDHCLACKGCRGECPVNVDIPTYKAEFLSHYYAGRLRPRSAYAFGLIHVWARLAAPLARLANFFMQTEPFASLLRWIAGVSQKRRLPTFALETFRGRYRRDASLHGAGGSRGPVLLWPDTFNDHFHPEVCEAAARVLVAAGFEVRLPARDLCCGRPLYDYGMLKTAKRWLGRILETLRPALHAGTPIVVLEPSCLSVFKDELGNMFPSEVDAHRLRTQAMSLPELFAKHAPEFQFPALSMPAALHGHCHHRALLDFEAEKDAAKKLAPEVKVLDVDCCGMAGAFGFEREHADLAAQVGELSFLPQMRALPLETCVITDGFSCREQLRQHTPIRGRHIAEVMWMALKTDPSRL